MAQNIFDEPVPEINVPILKPVKVPPTTLPAIKSKGPFKRIKHIGQILSSIFGWCWAVFDQYWMLEC